jgi:AcrR family transcriptional regulator
VFVTEEVVAVGTPEPPWRSPRRKPARQPLGRELIVDTAMKILAAEGLDAVSMRRIAQALNTGPASLYAHIGNKDELYELMFDRVLGEIELPEPDPKRWREQLKEVGRAQARAMVQHPGIARVVMDTVVPVGPNALRHGERVLAILRAGGLSERAAAFAFDALGLYVKAYAVEASRWMRGEIDPEEVAERGRQITEYMAALPPDVFPNMLAIGPLFSADTAVERFEFALDAFVGGLAAMVTPTRAASRGRAG